MLNASTTEVRLGQVQLPSAIPQERGVTEWVYGSGRVSDQAGQIQRPNRIRQVSGQDLTGFATPFTHVDFARHGFVMMVSRGRPTLITTTDGNPSITRNGTTCWLIPIVNNSPRPCVQNMCIWVNRQQQAKFLKQVLEFTLLFLKKRLMFQTVCAQYYRRERKGGNLLCLKT